ncbi:GumC family protein [Marichromatium bheemlicum]|uniref:non-specific protein-tyrosine kinase n=1 Tax=Marichromatium bheemlicum TaxID=365339 RepID=A0ABX1IEQ2_9GAMM|nr:polysaccharide biosynthesis tyrosine autokinase [Marichromatium bheemlicum]NKN34551.1 polysaccharide biosynthesis tyrosine autokinase [Marichromatium bheemlicum]
MTTQTPAQPPMQPQAMQPMPPFAGQVAPDNDADLIDLRELFRTLWRRRGVIIGTVLLFTTLAVIFALQLTPRYTASALLTLQTRQEAVVDIQAVMSGLSTDASVIRTELDVISSRRLIGKLVDQLQLTKDPEFNAELREPSVLARLLDPRTYLSADWLAALGLGGDATEALSADERAQRERAAVISAVTETLSATNPKLSYTIKIAFESEDPKKAARLANTLAELYLTDQLEAKFEATQRATDWLSTRIRDLRAKVLAAETAVQEYRERHKIVQGSQGTVTEQQLAELNVQLITAQTDLAQAEARYHQVQEQVAQQGNAAALGDVLRAPLVQSLSEQEAEVRRKLAEITKRYGPRHPDTIAVKSELADIRGKLAEEVDKIVASLANDMQVAQARVDTLSASLKRLARESSALEKSRVELRELERDAESSRVLLETFLSRFKETSNQEDLQQADARIISEAQVPVVPSFPNKKLIVAVALVLSLMIGLGLAFLLEALDNGFRALVHLERETRLKGLGMVPKITAARLKSSVPVRYALDKPTSAFAEALRAVHTSLMFGHPGERKPKILLATSALPGEGKTTFCASLGLLLARAGNTRVLYVEADLRRPNLAKAMPGLDEDRPCITDYLTGRVARWQDCVIHDTDTGLALMAAGTKVRDPQTLLQSERMRDLVREAGADYDLVIIDTPPLLAVSDAVILTHYVDTTLFIVRWESTARDAVKSALDLLRKAGAPIGGAVLSQVDAKRHAYYGYGDRASYYGRYGDYYTN